MLPFNNGMTSNEPISDSISDESLNQWYAQLSLILTNGLMLFASVYLYRLQYGVGGTILLFAAGISYFYHQCQTTRFCPVYDLDTWTLIDHISATMVIAYVIIFTVAPSKPLKKRRRDMKDTYYHQYIATSGENTFHDTWGASIAVAYFFIIVLSTLAYPYSSQNYIIALVFGLAAIFLQLVVINEGNVTPVKERLSVPDLIVAIILFALAAVCFFVDAWLYWLPHSLWHAFVNIALYFYFVGLTRSHPYHYSIFNQCLRK
jgi:hypothetical protein